MVEIPQFDADTEIELQAAAFRALRDHLQSRTDVQNIDMMTLTGFCRNCLSRWVQEAADTKGITLSKQDARAYVYGMDYEEWRAAYQTEATASQKQAFANTKHD
jgi:hypothetical protein